MTPEDDRIYLNLMRNAHQLSETKILLQTRIETPVTLVTPADHVRRHVELAIGRAHLARISTELDSVASRIADLIDQYRSQHVEIPTYVYSAQPELPFDL